VGWIDDDISSLPRIISLRGDAFLYFVDYGMSMIDESDIYDRLGRVEATNKQVLCAINKLEKTQSTFIDRVGKLEIEVALMDADYDVAMEKMDKIEQYAPPAIVAILAAAYYFFR